MVGSIITRIVIITTISPLHLLGVGPLATLVLGAASITMTVAALQRCMSLNHLHKKVTTMRPPGTPIAVVIGRVAVAVYQVVGILTIIHITTETTNMEVHDIITVTSYLNITTTRVLSIAVEGATLLHISTSNTTSASTIILMDITTTVMLVATVRIPYTTMPATTIQLLHQ